MKKTLSSKGVFKVQLFKRIGATVFVVIIVFTIAAPCFSTPVAIEGIDIFTALYNAYLVARGVDSVGSSNDAPWTVSEPASSATWRDLWQQNFDYYASQVDQTVTDVDAWVSAYIDQLDAEIRDRLNPSQPPEDPNDNGVIGLQFTAQLTEFFDKFTNLIFKDKYNMTNDGSGFVHSSGTFDSPLASDSSASLNSTLLYLCPSEFIVGYYYDRGWKEATRFSNLSASAPVYAFLFPYSNYRHICFVSDAPFSFFWEYEYLNGWPGVTVTSTQFDGSYAWPYMIQPDINYTDNSPVPFISSYNNTNHYPLATNTVDSSSSLLSLSPSDRIGTSPIPVPDTDDEDYVPAPLDVPLNIPWTSTMDDPDFSDDTDPAAEAIIDAITGEVATNTLSTLEPVTPDPPLASPSPVMPPFLPSEPPPFNFNLSGIWYYVVRWVNSMRSGMGWLMNIWSNIPAAMFYPVFGSAVVVIVLGVWRRFVA